MPFSALPSKRLPGPLAYAVNRFLKIDQLEALYSQTCGETITANILKELKIDIEVSPIDLSKIPPTGPVVAVSNHPHGILDGIVLADLLPTMRRDIRILTNTFLGDLPELAEMCFFIDPFDKPENRIANSRALKQSIQHLRAGGFLLIFPSGEVSHFDMKKRAICDPEWTTTAVRLIRMTRAKALPILIRGANSLSFQMLGMVHPRLRTAALPNELLNKRGKRVEIRIGAPVDINRMESLPDDAGATAYLRMRSELLGKRAAGTADIVAASTPIAEGVATETLRSEVAQLPPECLLDEARDLRVYVANAWQMPHTLREIGRQREITFRAAGEGSGEPLDIDRYDNHYLHLFLWNTATSEVVGAYRLGDIPKILSRYGSRGLYTKSLFRFQPRFFHRLGPALELGRSFVRPEYQRRFAPLLLLWKGIGQFVARHPEYKTLIGPVSVSNRYSPASRELIAGYFEKCAGMKSWFSAVRPRHKLKGDIVQKWEREAISTLFPDFEDLSAPIGDLEPDGKGLPILVKQYVRLGGKLLAFSVDPQFGDSLDGFVLVDLTQTAPETLSRYMGREQADRFFAHHFPPSFDQAA